MKVLIAEDEAISRRLLQSYLEKWGHEVVVARDGAEAWKLFEASEFPLVITDWMMPEMDGVELIRRIRATQRPGYVYTILLTAKSQKEDIVEGMEAGADDFVTKPFDRDELRVRLRAGQRIIELETALRDSLEKLAQVRK
jgi:two-component system NtrC family sensor kinase